jgi:hypothetical protein
MVFECNCGSLVQTSVLENPRVFFKWWDVICNECGRLGGREESVRKKECLWR